MNLPHSPRSGSALLLSLIAAAGLSATSLFAQSVATAPVGAVTLSVNANADQRIGISLQRAALLSSAVSSVSTGTITIGGSVPSLGADSKYVRFTSGTLAGQWFTLTSSGASTLTVSENLQSLGAQAGDKFSVIPFWTLNTLFPNGAGLPTSSDAFNPVAFIVLNDPSSSGVNIAPSSFYFFHNGGTEGIDAGWLDNADPFSGAVPNVIIPPESSIIVRNLTNSSAKAVTVGNVPASVVSNYIVARASGSQDNLVYNPYPAQITLAASGLANGTNTAAVKPSSSFFDPSEFVILYSSSSTSVNGAPSAFYFYYKGDEGFPEGWYDNASGELADSVVIPHSAAITIRKVPAGSFTETVWTPSLPYTL